MKRLAHAIAVTLLLGIAGQATARHSVHAAPPQQPPHDATTPPAADPRTATTCSPEHAAMGHCTPTRVDPTASPACSPDHAAMGHCTPLATPTPTAPCSPEHAAMGHHTPVPAPAGCTPEHAAMGHCTPTRVDPPASPACSPDHAAMGHCTPPATRTPTAPCSPEHAAMGHCAPTRVDPTASPACSPDHAAMGHCTPPATPTPTAPCSPEHAAMGHCTPAPAPAGCTPEHAAMGHCAPAPAMPREPVPSVTGADRAAAFPVLSHAGMVHAPARYTRVTLHRLEGWGNEDERGAAWEASASTGGDIHRLWLRGGGERTEGSTTAAHVELQASRAVARWWDVVAGVRHDIRPGEPRTRAALGVRGLAPYMFEVSATAYLGAGGLSAELEAEYDLRFTNRLVLQPSLELELDARNDEARGTGRGLSTAEAGLRLRYEVTRRFAPYVGVVHERAFGATARAREAAGGHAREMRVVAGVRIWF